MQSFYRKELATGNTTSGNYKLLKMKKSDWVSVAMGVLFSSLVTIFTFLCAQMLYAGCDSVNCTGNKAWESAPCSQATYDAVQGICVNNQNTTQTLNCNKGDTTTEADCSDCTCRPSANAINGDKCYCRLTY
jgi:hypothetical protein